MEVLTIDVGTFFSKCSMIQVHNTSKVFKEFHKISKDKVCHLQLTTRYVNNFKFQNVFSKNAKNDFLNPFFSSKIPLSVPNKKLYSTACQYCDL